MNRKILKLSLCFTIAIAVLSLMPFSISVADDTLSTQDNGTTAGTTDTPPPTQDNGSTAGNSSGGGGGSSLTPTPVHLDIETNVDVPASCSETDTDGVIHNYPKGDSYLTICALEAAINNGSISSLQLSNQYPSLGLFVTTVNNVVANPSSQYWAIYKNGSYANSGIALLPVVAGDVIMFQLHDFSDNNLGDRVTLNIHSLVNDTPSGGGGGGIAPSSTFDIQKALTYLKSTQDADGSFGNSILYTDWAGIALEAMNANNNSSDNSKNTLLSYFNSNNTLSTLLTDNERHAMALLSLGQNPYSFNGVNYIGAITNSFDGTQFGDANLINDDIFALILLKNSGYTTNDDIIVKDIAYIISKQETNGSWENSVDLTASTIQALKSFESITGVENSLSKATNYLTNSQNNDGGWGNDTSSSSNVSSTSWAMQAMSALGTSSIKNNKTGLDYLGEQQMADGAVSPSSETLQNRIWATSYAIAASSLKPWSAIMQTVPKQTVPSGSNSSLNNSSTNPSTDTTSKNTEPQTPANPVICPKGDLFSATTGQACTVIATTALINPPQANSKNKKELPVDNKINLQNGATNKNTNEIISNALSATAINALSAQAGLPAKTASHTFLIILGILSGIILLYLLIRFLIK